MSSKLTIRKLAKATLLAAALIGLTGFIGAAGAAPKICDDGTRPPCGGGGGGGGGGNDPPDFGDLIILYRDASGVPILDGNQCQQPTAFPSDTCLLECSDTEPCLVPLDPLTCAVEIGYAACTQEVDFGRINLARSTESVFESQLEDVKATLATADCVSLDSAGRLVAATVGDEGEVRTSTVDSPFQNLALYRDLMLTDAMAAYLPDGVTMIDTAARGLGVASDKSGGINVDMVAYINHIMGLTAAAATPVLEKICIDVKEEVAGSVELVEKCFLNYGVVPEIDNEPYAYRREDNFSSLPAPAYIGGPDEGWFEYLAPMPASNPPVFEILYGPILDAVFADDSGVVDPGFTQGNIGGFAQASDDTRAVIQFMHDWAVPSEYETEVPCGATPGPESYDLSISEESGLQVPVQMIANTEGREFTVTVSNAGPDVATGMVTVTAEPAAGGPVIGSPWVIEFSGLAAGTSASTTEMFTVSEPYARTTIAWTATVDADNDVNPFNNSVTETTNVRVTGGGGKP